jgi:ABC-type oligopeptide transport system ATPase subunit
MNSDSENEEQQPDWIPEPPHTTILLIGRSGSGKSTLCRFILKQFKKYRKPIYVVNDPKKLTKYAPKEWHEIAQLKQAALVVEDVIQAKPYQFEILQNLLNFKTHHDRVNPVLVIAHQLTKNNIFGIINSFTQIYITACKANIAAFKALLQYYGYPDKEKEEHLRMFRSITKPYQHICFDVEKMTFELTSFDMNDLSDDDGDDELSNSRGGGKKGFSRKAALALAKATRFLTVDKDHAEKKVALFELIYPGLPPKGFCLKDMTVKLKTNKNTEAKVSLIDYITCLVSEAVTAPPTLLLQFHDYITETRSVTLPRTFVLNKAFR